MVSIHAPARGATEFYESGEDISDSFNPRAREGRDVYSVGKYTNKIKVSIHAPARGATLDGVARADADQSFNPRAREGRDSPIPSRVSGPK